MKNKKARGESPAEAADELERLREGEARYRTLAETASDAIIVIDEASTILFVNPAAEKIFGHERSELLGAHLTVLMPDYLRHLHNAGMGRYLETGRKHISWDGVELPGLHKSGREIPLEVSFGEFARDGRRFFTGIARDITERKRTERRVTAQLAVTRALAESATLEEAAERILQSICETLSWEMGAFWVVEREARLLRCVQIWHAPGVSVPEFEEMSWRQKFPVGVGMPGHCWQIRQAFWVTDIADDERFPRAAVAAREGLHGAFCFPILLGGEVLGVMEFFSREAREPDPELLDVMAAVGSQTGQFVERKHAESALRLSEESYRSLFENANDIIYAHDLEGNFTSINKAGEEITGYSREEVVGGMNISDIVAPEHLAQAKKMLARKLRELTPTVYELEIVNKRGHRVTLEVSTRLVMRDGEPAGVEGIGRDITERKLIERERERLREEVIHVQQALLAELSTPLIPIKEQVVVMPLIGAMNAQRATQMLNTLLEGVRSTGARVAILDITGVPTVDTQVANVLINAAQSVRLLGVEIVITGIRARVAQTLVGLGVDLGVIPTRRDLQSGIDYAVRTASRLETVGRA